MASPLIVANNVASQLVANVGPSDTAFLVAAGQGARFPSPTGGQYFYATLVHFTTGAVEVVKCTARTLDTLTVVRGQDNTTAISLTVGSVVEMREVAVIFQEIDWRTLANLANGPLVLNGSAQVTDAQIPASITRDTELAAAIAALAGTIPGALGFTPVQQGTGIAQLDNNIKIGWKLGSKLGLTIDATDMGNIALESWRDVANGIAPLDGTGLVPIAKIPALGYLPTAGGAMTGPLTSSSTLAGTSVQSAQDFKSSTATVVLGTTGAGTVFLRPNGFGSTTGQLQLASTGIASATNFTATSDQRLKSDIRDCNPRANQIDRLQLCTFVWDNTGVVDRGVIAQDVQRLFPEYVHADENGVLSVDKASLALEAVLGIVERLRALESKAK